MTKRVTSAELQKFKDEQDWKALWTAAIPYVKFAASQMKSFSREDLLQDGLLAMQRIVQLWDPARGKFSSFVITRAKYAMLRAQKKTMTAQMMGTILEQDSHFEENEEGPGELSYGEADHTPEGFGDPAAEIARWCAPEAAEKLLGHLPAETSLMLREIMGLPILDSQDEPEQVVKLHRRRGISRATAYVRMNMAFAKISDSMRRDGQGKSTGSLYPPEGRVRWRTNIRADLQWPGFWNQSLSSVMGDNDAWRESVGSVWNDWAWKPTDFDIMNGAKR